MTYLPPKFEQIQEDPVFAWDEIADRLVEGQTLRLTWDDVQDAHDLEVRRLRLYNAMNRRGIRVTTRKVDGGLHAKFNGRIPPKDDVIITTFEGGAA